MSAVRLPWRGSDGLTVHGASAWAGGLLLAALMVCTRGQHVASLDGLPSASWAVFFLAGALLRPVWMLPLLFGLASALADNVAAYVVGFGLGTAFRFTFYHYIVYTGTATEPDPEGAEVGAIMGGVPTTRSANDAGA